MDQKSTVTLLVGVTIFIVVIGFAAMFYIWTDGRAENDSDIAVVGVFVTGLITAMGAMTKLFMGAHDQMNSRLTQFIDAAVAAARLEGILEEKADQKSRDTNTGL